MATACAPGITTSAHSRQRAIARRKSEFRRWQDAKKRTEEPVTVCEAMSPVSYIGNGLTVEPLKDVRITGLQVHTSVGQFNSSVNRLAVLEVENSLGILYSDYPRILEGVKISGNYSNQVRISSFSNVKELNEILRFIVYRSTHYHIKARDVIHFRLFGHSADIRVLIHRPALPKLHVTHDADDNINGLVTVVTKTFERRFQGDRENPGNNIKHYQMPFAEGYNAGKNLLLSQVRTKYFLWVDDDFIFSKRTKLELFVEKLDSPMANLDLVGGMFEQDDGSLLPCICANTDNYYTALDISWGSHGYCLSAKKSDHGKVDQFPNCRFLDMVANFWMAKTEAVLKVGFDLRFERIAHREFFIDAVGVLRIAQCDDVAVRHVAIRNPKYNKYRFLEDKPEETLSYANHLLLKNYLHCYQSWYGPAMTKAMKKSKQMKRSRGNKH
ncbi:beta-1,4 N-acetylgalactosaminyltransferase 1-like [Ptychodera flava]|uniref:beta-1,4 N-acetylgalactosaminyltransferase 1-like n=1 Tax=Ptychodera flava TaxID=63121 RepID=UPI00396A8DB7